MKSMRKRKEKRFSKKYVKRQRERIKNKKKDLRFRRSHITVKRWSID